MPRSPADSAEPHRGGRRVTLWTAAGGPVRLPLPMTNKVWNEATFLRGYHQIGRLWEVMRGPDGQLPS